MTYEKIKTVADALCVDILDLLKDLLSNKELLHMILSDENFSDKLLSALHGAMEELGENYKDASGLPAIRIDFPYEIESEHSLDDSEFEFDLLDQAMDAFLYDVTAPDSDPALTEIFLDHLDKCCENPDIVEYPAHDLSQYIRQRQQEQKYKQIAAKIYEKSGDIPGFIDAIASTFSLIKEDPEYERRTFTEYGLETE